MLNYIFSRLLLKLLLISQNVVLVTYKVPAACLPFYLVPLVSVVFLLLQTAVSTDFWKSWAFLTFALSLSEAGG